MLYYWPRQFPTIFGSVRYLMVVSYKSFICDVFGSEPLSGRQSEGNNSAELIDKRSRRKNKYTVTCAGPLNTLIPGDRSDVQEERVRWERPWRSRPGEQWVIRKNLSRLLNWQMFLQRCNNNNNHTRVGCVVRCCCCCCRVYVQQLTDTRIEIIIYS